MKLIARDTKRLFAKYFGPWILAILVILVNDHYHRRYVNLINVNHRLQVQMCASNSTLDRGQKNSSFCSRDRSLENNKWEIREPLTLDELNEKYKNVMNDGYWYSNSTSIADSFGSYPIAVIIPFRNREKNLAHLLTNLIPFLQMQKTAFQIIIVNQAGPQLFNRGWLLNIGYLEALRISKYRPQPIYCFVFHDVDKIPMNRCLKYNCRHNEAVRLYYRRYRQDGTIGTMYGAFVGGVLALTNKMMVKMNGCPTTMYGWGGEDDNMYYRLRRKGYGVFRDESGDYAVLSHRKDLENPRPRRYIRNSKAAVLQAVDGLTTSLNYSVVERTPTPMYINVTVIIPGPTSLRENKDYFLTSLKSTLMKMVHSNHSYSEVTFARNLAKGYKWDIG